MIAGDMRASLALLAAAATATGALAAPQASGPRNLAMGGTGVASSDPWTAPFANPALTRFRDERTGLSVALPFLTATVRDDQELFDAIDEFQDTIDTLQALVDDGKLMQAAVQRAVALTQLEGLEGRALTADAEVGFAALCERSACAKLAQYVHDKELVAMCNQCCSDRGGGTRYQAAALEMCD